MQTDKMRVYTLAKQLDVESKILVDVAKELGYAVNNQLSSLTAEQCEAVTDRVKRGSNAAPVGVATPVIPQVANKVQTLPQRKPRLLAPPTTPPVIAAPPAPVAKPVEAPPAPTPVVAEQPAPKPVAPPAPPKVETPAAAPVVVEKPAPVAPPVVATPPTPVAPPAPPVAEPPAVAAVATPTTQQSASRTAGVPNLSSGRAPASASTLAAPPAPVAYKPKPAVVPPAAVPPAPIPTPPAQVAASATPTATPPTPPAPATPAPTPAPMAGGGMRNLNSGGGMRNLNSGGSRPNPANAPSAQQGQRPGGPVSPSSTGPRPGGPTAPGPRPAPSLRQPGRDASPAPGYQTSRRPSPSNRLVPPGGGGSGGPGRNDGGRSGSQPASARGDSSPKPAPPGPSKAKKLEVPKELLMGDKPIDVNQIVKQATSPTAHIQPPTGFTSPGSPPVVPTDDDDKNRPGKVLGRDGRRVQRDARAQVRKTDRVSLEGGQVVVVEDDRPSRSRDSRRHKPARPKGPGTVPRKGKVSIELPISVRGLSEAIGLAVPKVLGKLVSLGMPLGTVNINSYLEGDIAELVAVEHGIELEIRKPQDAEDDLDASNLVPDAPESLVPRAPIVTIMGHVDHGKTSLLDKIRRSNVVDTEAGGITQVIRAWRVEHNGKPITFLDTPGHQAFTAMRARGAQVTDIAVIVCAADDGVMPQTEEAINHAKAAGVKIVVAINKVDLPNANVPKARQQLYGMNLLPDNMGGDVPFVETSAAKGIGIDELLEAISLVAELQLDLKANPNKPAKGVCLEANLSGDEGVFATLIVRDGTLKKGDIVICGSTHGRVRAMYNDMGRSISEAGPSLPVQITGLDMVPNADDPFQAVADLATAREIAEKRAAREQEASMGKYVSSARTLDSLAGVKISELKVILKADFRGSVEAIKKELEKLQHEEVRVRVLHTGIGAITTSDVQLALTSPTDTLVVGFNCVPDDDALKMAEERGVQIREFDIIYNLTNDIKMSLEGKLKPREEVIHLGRAVVRSTFKISKVGVIAGCYVTQGTMERSAKVRVIREGVVVYPPAEKVANLESLKRFKDDAKEVHQGFECGIKLAGYNDIKTGDVIEAYRIEQVMRTL